ncbi:MAG TPA: AMP-binding protein [Candidatus Omnitrophota bacterium]|nr:AMP-binding protein [Candidatus Omnitrophota bacterium]
MDPWRHLKNLNKSQITELQNKKLRDFIRHYVYPFSPHYRKIFDDNKIDPESIKTADDLRRVPFISKKDFLENETKFRDCVLQPDAQKIKKFWNASRLTKFIFERTFKGKEYVEHKLGFEFRPVFMTFTGGTTNQPVVFLYTNYDIQNLHTSGARMVNLFDIKPDERIVNIFPYAPHLAFWQVVFGAFASNVMALSTGGGKTIGTEGNIKALLRMKPSVVMGVPSYVYHVFRTAREQGCKMDFVKKVVLGAARVTVAFKQKLAEIIEGMGARDVAIFGTYGFTEARCAWAESPSPLDVSSGYHLYPDKEIFEVIDPETGEVKKEGEDGELVYTGLDARGSVMLRYRTGDFVKGGITYAPSKYSRLSVPRISSDITRLSDVKDLQFSKVKGALMNFSVFPALFSEIKAIDEWQIELKKRNNDPFDMDEMVIYATIKNHNNPDKLKEEIKSRMVAVTEVSPNEIHFIGMDEMVKRLELETANKERRILDNRPKS